MKSAGAVIQQRPVMETDAVSVRRQRISKVVDGKRYESSRLVVIQKQINANKEWLQ